jgi:uncharacterized protein YbjT (DUF2867 family)
MVRGAPGAYRVHMRVRTVLVTGATGNQGGGVAAALLHKGHRVRAFVRDAASPRAVALAAAGAELHEGEFDDPVSLVTAADGADAIFVVSTPFEEGPEAETRHAMAMIDAALQVEMEQVVYSSVASADRHTGVPHFESKARVERYLQRVPIGWTVVAPAFFRENLLRTRDVLSLPLPEGRKLQTLGRHDLGQLVTHVLEHPTVFDRKRIDLASDSSTGPEMARAISEASGRQVRWQPMPVPTGDDDLSRMWVYLAHVGYSADIAALRRLLPLQTFAEWARSQAWGGAEEGARV